MTAIVLAARGVLKARAWAQNRRERSQWVTTVRLGWLVIPTLLTASLPRVITLLTSGTQTLTWAPASFLLLSPLITLTACAAAGLVVLVARIRSLLFSQGDTQPVPSSSVAVNPTTARTGSLR